MLCLQLTYIVHLVKCCFCGDYFVISYFCILSGLQSYKEYVGESICEQEHMDIVRNSCPAARACGGMYTANTMASVCHWSSWHVPSSTSTYIPSADFIFYDEILDCLLCNIWILQEMMKQCSCFRSEVCKCPKTKKNKRVLDSQFLSHLGMDMLASYHCTPMTVSMLSPIRLCNWRL